MAVKPPCPQENPSESSVAFVHPHAMERLSQSMPWVISLLFHVGLFLIMMFVMYIMIEDETPTAHRSKPVFLPVEQNFTDSVTRPMAPPDRNRLTRSPKNPDETKGFSKTNNEITTISAESVDLNNLLHTQGNRNALPSLASKSGGEFFGLQAKTSKDISATNVVYVIDCSGSMIDTFDRIRQEALFSVARLSDKQHYHVILFSQGRTLESPPRRLVRATRANRKSTAQFLQNVTPQHQTDPLPALRRAFAVLRNVRRENSAIFLLTDGVFPNSQKVLAELQALNANGNVSITTILYGTRPPEAEKTLKAIAEKHNGNYQFIPHE